MRPSIFVCCVGFSPDSLSYNIAYLSPPSFPSTVVSPTPGIGLKSLHYSRRLRRVFGRAFFPLFSYLSTSWRANSRMNTE